MAAENLSALKQGKRYRLDLKNSQGKMLSPEFCANYSIAKARKRDFDQCGIRATMYLIKIDGELVEAK